MPSQNAKSGSRRWMTCACSSTHSAKHFSTGGLAQPGNEFPQTIAVELCVLNKLCALHTWTHFACLLQSTLCINGVCSLIRSQVRSARAHANRSDQARSSTEIHRISLRILALEHALETGQPFERQLQASAIEGMVLAAGLDACYHGSTQCGCGCNSACCICTAG